MNVTLSQALPAARSYRLRLRAQDPPPIMTRPRSTHAHDDVLFTASADNTDSSPEPASHDESDCQDDAEVPASSPASVDDSDVAYYRRYEEEFDESALTQRPYSHRTMKLLTFVEKSWIRYSFLLLTAVDVLTDVRSGTARSPAKIPCRAFGMFRPPLSVVSSTGY